MREYSKKELYLLKEDINTGKRKLFPSKIWNYKQNITKCAELCLEEIVGLNPTNEQLYGLNSGAFRGKKWGGLLKNFHSCPALLVTSVYPHLVIYKFKKTPKYVFKNKAFVKGEATKCLAELFGDSPTDEELYGISNFLLKEKGWGKLVQEAFGDRANRLVLAAYPHLCKYKFKRVERNLWREDTYGAVSYCLAELVGDNPTEEDLYNLRRRNFEENGWAGLLGHFNNSPIKLILIKYPNLCQEKFPHKSLTPTDLPTLKKSVKNCLIEILGENYKENDLYNLSRENIAKSGWSRLLRYFNDNVLELIKIAHPDICAFKRKTVPMGTWQNKEELKKAIDICFKEILRENFTEDDLYSLTGGSFKNTIWTKLLNAFQNSTVNLVMHNYPSLFKCKFKIAPSGLMDDPLEVKKAVKLCIQELVGDEPSDEVLYSITGDAVKNKGWGGLLQKAFNSKVNDMVKSQFPHLDENNFIRYKNQRIVKAYSEEVLGIKCSYYGDQYSPFFKPYNLKPDVCFDDLKLAIEYHGVQHSEFHPFFHRNNPDNFTKQQERDKKLRDICNNIGFHLIEIFHYEHKNCSIKKILYSKIKSWKNLIILTSFPP